MIQVDLITGFLGSGKTTFLKTYAAYLLSKGLKIAILVNDYGAINVDMMLLQELGESCEIEMVTGGSDMVTHKRRFRAKLIGMGMRGYDRVVIEPSGIFDVSEFFDILYEEPLSSWYEVGSVITIVDAKLNPNASKQSAYILANQLSQAGIIVMSKVQEANETEINRTLSILKETLKIFRSNRVIEDDLIIKDWQKLDEEDYRRIMDAYYRDDIAMHSLVAQDYQSLFFMNKSFDIDALKERVRALFQDTACGEVIRVKGFIKEDDHWLQVNATRHEISVSSLKEGQEIIIVIGENLNEDRIRFYFDRHS